MLRDMFSFQDLNTAQLQRKFSTAGITNYVEVSATGGRDNGPCLRITSNYGIRKTYDYQSHWIVGLRTNFKNGPLGNTAFVYFNEGYSIGKTLLLVAVNASGTISAYLGEGLIDSPYIDADHILATSTRTLNSNTEYYIEVEAVFAAEGGSVKVNVNGSNTGWINYSGNTLIADEPIPNVICWSGICSNYTYYCDMYVADGQAGDVTAMLGPRRCDAYFFQADGHYTDWTQSTGANLHGCVDDNPANDDSDYISGASGNKFTLKTLSMGYTPHQIDGVKLNGIIKNEDVGTAIVKRLIRKSTTDYESSELPPADLTYTCISDVLEHDPATSARFTKSDLESALEFGFDKTF